MPISNYPSGFANGVTLRNLPLILTQIKNSKVFWVDSTTGSNGNKGTFIKPLATIKYALTLCTANQGDTIIAASGHQEDVIADGDIDFDVAGVNVIFLGQGASRATLTFKTSASASIHITAKDVTLINPQFICDIDALADAIQIKDEFCKIINGLWFDKVDKATTNCIDANTSSNWLQINGWRYYAETGGTQKVSHIKIYAFRDFILSDIDIAGDFSTGNIDNSTNLTSNARFENMTLKNTNATPAPGMVIHANTTGYVKNTDIRIASGTTYVSSNAKLNWDNNALGYNADGGKGTLIGT
jgi:uncharacterized Zn-binding protein involved in type VI secretion